MTKSCHGIVYSSEICYMHKIYGCRPIDMFIDRTKEMNMHKLNLRTTIKQFGKWNGFLLVALLQMLWSTHHLDLLVDCQACHEPKALAVAGGYLDLNDIANFIQF